MGNHRRVEAPIELLVAEAKRELKLRIQNYPGIVRAGRMKQADMVRQIALQRGILHTLLNLQDGAVWRRGG